MVNTQGQHTWTAGVAEMDFLKHLSCTLDSYPLQRAMELFIEVRAEIAEKIRQADATTSELKAHIFDLINHGLSNEEIATRLTNWGIDTERMATMAELIDIIRGDN